MTHMTLEKYHESSRLSVQKQRSSLTKLDELCFRATHLEEKINPQAYKLLPSNHQLCWFLCWFILVGDVCSQTLVSGLRVNKELTKPWVEHHAFPTVHQQSLGIKRTCHANSVLWILNFKPNMIIVEGLELGRVMKGHLASFRDTLGTKRVSALISLKNIYIYIYTYVSVYVYKY